MVNIDERLGELYKEIYYRVGNTYQIFIDYFGEDKVDLQGTLTKTQFINLVKTLPLIDILNDPFDNFSFWKEIRHKSLKAIQEEEGRVQCIEHILNNFINYYNRDRLGGCYILIWWPHVRITNEHDKFVDIDDLYAKVNVSNNGALNGRFTLNRATYSLLHLKENYMHSHVCSIPTQDFTQFQQCCTGTGPINDTMCTLNREFDADIWQLFCIELDKYVHVESLTGGPYHRLEELGKSSMYSVGRQLSVQNELPYYCQCSEGLPKDKWKEFFIYLVNKRALKFNYRNGSYGIGIPFADCLLVISNIFIEWYNKMFNDRKTSLTLTELGSQDIIKECIISNGKLYYPKEVHRVINARQYEGEYMCTFKGKEMAIHITDIEDIDLTKNHLFILEPSIILYYINKILEIINYRYGRYRNSKDSVSSTESTQVSSDVYLV